MLNINDTLKSYLEARKFFNANQEHLAKSWDKPTHAMFNVLGPVSTACPIITSFKSGDGETRICGNVYPDQHCNIISIGSYGLWDFEESAFNATSALLIVQVHGIHHPQSNQELHFIKYVSAQKQR